MTFDKLVIFSEVNARDKLKTKYFFCQKMYGHQTLQGTNI